MMRETRDSDITPPCRALVLGGGGARGALQVGALRALCEADMCFDLLVGTSAGAVNATYLAVHGVDVDTLAQLREAWQEAGEADLLPTSYLRLSMCLLLGHVGDMDGRLEAFYRRYGMDDSLTFGDIDGVRLIQVAADLATYRPRLYGTRPDQSVLEGLLASTAVPPWVWPMERGQHRVMDGGLVSNLPVEPALRQGATAIIALDLSDWRFLEEPTTRSRRRYMAQMLATMERREIELELRLAELSGVPVWRVPLRADPPAPFWDFTTIERMFVQGYEQMTAYIDAHSDCISAFCRHKVNRGR